jgi:DNA-directed RNA polymerase specialized sigma24 family protein
MATMPLTTPGPLPDATLLRRMAGRDATALIELERRYGASLYALVYGILMDSDRAERLVAEVFEQVWHTAELLSQRHRGAYSWLRQAARERALKHRATPDSQ